MKGTFYMFILGSCEFFEDKSDCQIVTILIDNVL